MTTPQPENSPVRDPEKRVGIMFQILKGLKLKIRLLKDPRISVWLKLGFAAGILWILFPDLVVGPIDDAIVFYFLANFEDFCPKSVVREVLKSLEEEEKNPQGQKKRLTMVIRKGRPVVSWLISVVILFSSHGNRISQKRLLSGKNLLTVTAIESGAVIAINR